MMEFLDREPVAVSKDGVFLVTGNAGETLKTIPSAMQTFFEENGLTLSVEGNTDSVITLSGFTSGICVVDDSVFDALQPQMKNTTITVFHYDNWETNSRSPEVIKEALAEIERMKTEILNLQGAAECPNCGARMPQGASFCSSCGTKMAEPEHFTGEVVDDEKFDE